MPSTKSHDTPTKALASVRRLFSSPSDEDEYERIYSPMFDKNSRSAMWTTVQIAWKDVELCPVLTQTEKDYILNTPLVGEFNRLKAKIDEQSAVESPEPIPVQIKQDLSILFDTVRNRYAKAKDSALKDRAAAANRFERYVYFGIVCFFAFLYLMFSKK